MDKIIKNEWNFFSICLDEKKKINYMKIFVY